MTALFDSTPKKVHSTIAFQRNLKTVRKWFSHQYHSQILLGELKERLGWNKQLHLSRLCIVRKLPLKNGAANLSLPPPKRVSLTLSSPQWVDVIGLCSTRDHCICSGPWLNPCIWTSQGKTIRNREYLDQLCMPKIFRILEQFQQAYKLTGMTSKSGMGIRSFAAWISPPTPSPAPSQQKITNIWHSKERHFSCSARGRQAGGGLFALLETR